MSEKKDKKETPERVCEYCGKPVERKKYKNGLVTDAQYAARRYCSVQCLGLARRETVCHRLCLNCGAEIERKQTKTGLEDIRAYRERKYCSRACWQKHGGGKNTGYREPQWLKQKYHTEGLSALEIAAVCGVSETTVNAHIFKHGLQKQKHPGARHKKKKNRFDNAPAKYCAYCGRHLERKIYSNGVPESITNHERRKFCDSKCMGLSKIIANPTPSALGVRAKKYRKKACENCGTALRLHGHHIDGNRKNNTPENIMTLCAVCHTKWHWAHGKRAPMAIARRRKRGTNAQAVSP